MCRFFGVSESWRDSIGEAEGESKTKTETVSDAAVTVSNDEIEAKAEGDDPPPDTGAHDGDEKRVLNAERRGAALPREQKSTSSVSCDAYGVGVGVGVGSVDVNKIVAGGNHTVLLTGDDHLFSAGKFGCDPPTCVFVQRDFDFNRGASGVQADMATDSSPTMTVTGRITDIAATWDASFVVVDHQTVFACGTGAKGELGLGQGVERAEKMTRVFDVANLEVNGDATSGNGNGSDTGSDNGNSNSNSNIQIRAIAASMAHVVVLLSNGHVYGWGSCRKGQLGEHVKNQKILWTPTRIDQGLELSTSIEHNPELAIKVVQGFAGAGCLPWNPTDVVVGREYTVFLRTGEKPVVWGDAKFISDGDSEFLKRPLRDGDRLVSAWSSIHLYSPSQKSVHSTGRNHRGQLAPAGLPDIRVLATGSEHCVALTADNHVIAWGWGEHGNCGEELDDKGNVAGRWNVIHVPRLDDASLTVTGVAAGCATSFVVCGIKDE